MRRGEIWWVEFDERRPVVLLSEDEPSGFRAMQVVAPADTDISGLGIEVAVGVPEGLPFEGVLRFAFPWPGFTPCTWLTTLSRDDLIERAGAVSTAKLSEIDDALRASEQRTEWTPAAAARLSEIKDSLRRRTQADGEGTDAHAAEGRSRPHDRRSATPQQQEALHGVLARHRWANCCGGVRRYRALAISCTGAATRAPSCCSAWSAAPESGQLAVARPCSPKSGESRSPSRTSTSPSRPWPGWRAWFPGAGEAVFAVACTAGWIAHAPRGLRRRRSATSPRCLHRPACDHRPMMPWLSVTDS